MKSIRRLIDYGRNTQFVRFLAVGVLNFTFGYGCYLLLLRLGMSDSMALLGATLAGILFNFKTTGVLVFNSRDNALIGRFILMYVVLYAINLATIKTLIALHLSASVAGGISFPFMAVLAYILNKRFVFRNV